MTTKNEKVSHVLSAPNPGGHTCHWPGCTKNVPPAMWGCKRHWFRLPLGIRNLIWREYEIGQEDRKDPSGEYITAAMQAQRWIVEFQKANPNYK